MESSRRSVEHLEASNNSLKEQNTHDKIRIDHLTKELVTAKKEIERLCGLCHGYEKRLGLLKQNNLRLSGVIIEHEKTITECAEVHSRNENLHNALNQAQNQIFV